MTLHKAFDGESLCEAKRIDVTETIDRTTQVVAAADYVAHP